MLTLVTGAPGTGKTAAVVDLITQLGKERALYVHGLDGLSLPHFPLADPTQWMSEVPDGSIIIIDEVQSIWRPRGPGSKVPDHVAALETHRHRGLDFYLTTQGPNLVDANVRALIGRHIHLREMGVLGRYWYEWPECADNCRTAWRGAPIKKRYRLPKRAFSLYKSASIHVKPVRSFPVALAVAVLALVGTGWLAWSVFSRFQERMSPAAAAASGVPSFNPSGSVTPVATVTPGRVPMSIPPALSRLASYQPREVGLPHTAPVYDALTAPTVAPYPAICATTASDCRCYTEQGTRLHVPQDKCRTFATEGFWRDWGTPDMKVGRGSKPLPKPEPPKPKIRDGSLPVVVTAPEPASPPPVGQAAHDGETIAWMRSR